MPAELILDGKTMQLPTIVGSEDEKAIDIRKLRAQTGYVTLDPAYMNTGADHAARSPSSTATRASCATAASPSKQLAEKSTFVEIAYLLIYGNLPNQAELEQVLGRS